jgi:hypothetical protein
MVIFTDKKIPILDNIGGALIGDNKEVDKSKVNPL